MLSITEVKEGFVARVDGIQIFNDIDPGDFATLRKAFEQYTVLIFHNQPLTQEQQLAFAEKWGVLEPPVSPYILVPDEERRLRHELADISNIDEKGSLISHSDNRKLVNKANQIWHTDSSFKRIPAKISILSAQSVVDVGGETEYADMRSAWDHLPKNIQEQIKPLVAKHDYFHSRLKVGLNPNSISESRRQLLPPVPQVLVRKDNITGRNSLYLASHISSIYGLDPDASTALLEMLTNHATSDVFVYQHKWSVNDVVMWDNRYTMHRGRPHDASLPRAMRRATIMDDGPTIPIGSEPEEIQFASSQT